MRRSLLILSALGLCGRLAQAAACAPASATLTFAADDYLYFYINGNAVVAPSGFDPGNPPISVSVPVGYFNAPGVANYFAAAISNSAASLVGGNWLLSITCGDGSKSYITNEDNTFTMYDDINGNAPPPSNWYLPAFSDPGSLFTGTPVLAPPLSWFNPKIKHPLTGVDLQMLSHSSSGTQFSDHEVLYFRQTIVLPVYSPTPTASPTPTFSVSPTPYPPGCGTPLFQDARLIATGCNPGSSFPYTLTAASNQLLLLRVETTASSTAPSNVQWAGSPMTLLSSGTSGYNSTRLFTYYLVNPAAGTNNITWTYPGGCNWNVAVELYSNVDTANPVDLSTSTGGVVGSPGFSIIANINVAAAIASVFMATEQACNAADVPLIGPSQVDHQFRTTGSAMACCECVFGDHKALPGPAFWPMVYNLAQNGRQAYVQLVIIQGGSCNTATPTPSFSVSPTLSATATVTSVLTATLTPTQSATPTISPVPTLANTTTFTATPSRTPSYTPAPAPPTATPTPAPLLLTPKSPNPNPAVTNVFLPYVLSSAANVSLKIYDVSGEKIRDFDPVFRPAGASEAFWDLKNFQLQRVASGVYLCKIRAENALGESDEVWEKVAVAR